MKKNYSAVNINFILILTIIIAMIIFAVSNYVKFNEFEEILGMLDEKAVNTEELKNFSELGIDVGNVGLDVLRVIFVWIPMIHTIFLLLFTGISRMIYRPSYQRLVAYRVLMTFAYLNIIAIIAVLIVGIMIHYSIFKKIKMAVFLVQCISILIWNFTVTYSKKITQNFFGRKKSLYDKENQIPVIKASICTGEQVAGFKDLHTGKFQEVMFLKNDKDMQKFLAQYEIDINDVKKEW